MGKIRGDYGEGKGSHPISLPSLLLFTFFSSTKFEVFDIVMLKIPL